MACKDNCYTLADVRGRQFIWLRFVIFVQRNGGFMKTKISEGRDTHKNIKTYSVEEILDAGGANAFATKMGKDRDSLIKALENAGPFEPFTEKEWNEITKILDKEK
jgi:hypothetical protein